MKSKLSIVNYQLSIIIILFFALPIKAQVNVGSADNPHPFSILELTTALKEGGLRLPQLSNTDRDKLHPESDPAAAQGLVIYNTDNNCVEFWSGSAWVDLCADVAPAATCVAAPGQPGEITGNQTPCIADGGAQTYSISSVEGATSYIWSLPDGWSISGKSDGISISAVPDGANAASGNISVKAANSCGSGPESTLALAVVTGPPILGAIITPGCGVILPSRIGYNTTLRVVYTVPKGVTSFTWTLPPGWDYVSQDDTMYSVTAKAGSAGGTISVTGTNSCGTATATGNATVTSSAESPTCP